MERSLVTIVIPSFNHEAYIGESVNSALCQDYRDVEILAIDDGSSDKSCSILRDFCKRFSNFKLIEQENRGAHNALNRAITEACGQYIAVLNSDDLFEENKISRCISIVTENPSTEFIFGGVRFINEAGDIQESGISVDWMTRALRFFDRSNLLALSLLNENFAVTTSNFFFTKELWVRNGGFMPLRYCHDLCFLMSSIRNANCCFDRSVPHIRYRVHDKNTIKENLVQIRGEIASVVASNLVLFGRSLFDHRIENLLFLNEFLDEKKMSSQIIKLLQLFSDVSEEATFYPLATEFIRSSLALKLW